MRRILIVLCLSIAAMFTAVTSPWASSPPCCAPVPDGIVSWWPADANANDLITGWNGTLQNGATATALGKVGTGWTFDGVDDFVSILDGEELYPGTGSMTIDGWIKTTADGVIAQHYECGGDCTGSPTSEWTVAVDGSGHVVATIRDVNGDDNVLTGTAVVDDDVFHHVAVVRDVANSLFLIYVDGVLDVSETLVAVAAIEKDAGLTDPVTAGAGRATVTGDVVNPFTGMIDELDYFNAAVSASEIAAIFGSGPSGKCRDEVDPSSAASTVPTTTTTTIAVSYTANDPVGQLQTITLWVKAPGETAFTEVAQRPTADNAGFLYTATKGTGRYEFYTLAEDTSCGREEAPAAPDSVTQVTLPVASVTPTPTPTATPTPTPVTPKPVTVPINTIARLPKRCTSRRKFRIRLRTITSDPVVAAEIRINGKLKKRVKGSALTLPVNLRGLPKRRVTVKITVTLKSGAKKVATRRYRTCVPKKRT